jgi:hypothetical protein
MDFQPLISSMLMNIHFDKNHFIENHKDCWNTLSNVPMTFRQYTYGITYKSQGLSGGGAGGGGKTVRGCNNGLRGTSEVLGVERMN